jgi:hypothetical protein
MRAADAYGTLKTLRDELRALRARGRVPAPTSPAAAVRSSPKPARARREFDGRVGLVRGARWWLHNALLENSPLHRLAGHMLLLVAERRPRDTASPHP